MEEFETFADEEVEILPSEGSSASLPIPNSRVTSRKAQDLSATLDVPIVQVKETVEVGNKLAEWDAKQSAILKSTSPLQMIEQGIERQTPLEDLSRLVSDRIQKEQDFVEIDEYLLEQALAVDTPEVNASLARYLTNQRILNDAFTKAIEDVNGNSAWDVVDFIDYGVFRYLINSVEDFTRRSERTGETVGKALHDMSPKDFKEFISQRIEESKAEGIFTSNNLFAVSREYQDASNLGYDPAADTMQALSLVDLVPFAGTAIRGVMKGSTALASTQVLKGMGTANNLARSTIRNLTDATDDGSLAATFGATSFDVRKFSIRPAFNSFMDEVRNNQVLQDLWRMNDEGTFGRQLTEAELKSASDTITENIQNRTNNAVLDFDITRDGPESYVLTARVGRNETMLPFEIEADAQAVADTIDASRVIPSPDGRGFLVEVEKRVINAEQVGPTNIGAATFSGFRDLFSSVFGSSSSRESVILSAQAALAEQGLGRVSQQIMSNARKSFKALSSDEGKRMDEILLDYRDGVKATQRMAPSRVEFELDYRNKFGEAPRKEVLDAYETLKDINDAAWFLKANQKVQWAAAAGHVMVRVGPDVEVRGVRIGDVGSISDNARIMDVATGVSMKREDLPAEAIVYSTVDVIGEHRYFTNVERTRVVEHMDVHGYNFGGPRSNPQNRFFVGYAGTKAIAGGEVVPQRYKTILGAFSEKEAALAADELNAISKALRDAVSRSGNPDWMALKGSKWADEVNTAIRQNNKWNPHITTIEDLEALSKKTGVDFATENRIYARGRDLPVTREDVGLDGSLTGGRFSESVLEFKGSNGPRLDEVLLEYGGRKSYNVDPLEATTRMFSNSVLSFANQAYSNRAIAGWVKAARSQGYSQFVTFPEGVKDNEFYRAFIGAQIKDMKGAGKQLAEQRDIIMRRLALSGDQGVTDMLGDMLTELLYKSSAKTIKADMNSGNPSGTLLKIGFYSKMGFWNFGQLIVQAMQVPVVTAISPIHGFKGSSMAIGMRIASALSGEAEKLAALRLGQAFGYSQKEVMEILDYIRSSGRLNVDVEAAELQTGINFTTRKGINQKAAGFLDASAGPFREGERMSRLTSEMTAILEFKDRFPEQSINSDFARSWITTRDQNLSFRMTATSRSRGQSGLMRVPTQWLTYTFRTMEALFIGKGLTAGERFRLAFPLMFFYGLTGTGVDMVLGRNETAFQVANFLGVDPAEDDFQFRLLKYGMMDALLSDLLPEGVTTSRRLAPLSQLGDTVELITEGRVLEVVFGPSGGITADIFSPLYEGTKALLHGQTNLAQVDFTKVLRNISMINNEELARGIILHGKYRGRSGAYVPGEFGITSAMMAALGFAPEKVTEWYDLKDQTYTSETKKREFIREQERYVQEAWNKLDSNDPAERQEFAKTMAEVSLAVDISGFSPQVQREVRAALLNPHLETIPRVMQRLARVGMEEEMARFGAVHNLGGDNN